MGTRLPDETNNSLYQAMGATQLARGDCAIRMTNSINFLSSRKIYGSVSKLPKSLVTKLKR